MCDGTTTEVKPFPLLIICILNKRSRDKDFIENNTWQPRAELRTVKMVINGKLDLPISVINLIIDFLSNRFQRIKLAEGCFSEWERIFPISVLDFVKFFK